MASAPPDHTGERLGPWVLADPIGRGAHSVVYRARHIDGREAALKVLDLKSSAHDAQEAFYRELAVMERFSNKNMPKFYGVANGKDTVAIAMQMARHGDVLDYLNSIGPLSENAAGVIFGQVCRTLSITHKNGIAHRDIKLENLLIDGDTVLLCDWGFAAFARPGELLTKPCGTHGYCAPEVTRGLPYTGSGADLYSVGVVLYALLVGSLPSTRPDRIVALSPDVTDLLAGLLEQDAANRWTMRQVKACKWWKQYCEEASGISRAFKGMIRRLSS